MKKSIPKINPNWNESNLSIHWFAKVIESLGYGIDGDFTFETEQRMVNSTKFKRKDFTLLIKNVPLITIELKKPSINLERSKLDFIHFSQAHKYAASHYVCRSDRFITPMGRIGNLKPISSLLAKYQPRTCCSFPH